MLEAVWSLVRVKRNIGQPRGSFTLAVPLYLRGKKKQSCPCFDMKQSSSKVGQHNILVWMKSPIDGVPAQAIGMTEY